MANKNNKKELVSDGFISEDYEKLMVNVHKVAITGSVYKNFEMFSRYPEFKKSLGVISKNKVLRFIVYYYDKNSPFQKRIVDVGKRKYEAAIKAGFDLQDNGKFKESVEDLLTCKNEIVNAMIVRYLIIHRNHKYAYLRTLEKAYYSLMEKVLNGDDTDVTKLRKIQEDIENTTIDITNEDNNVMLVDSLYNFMESEDLGLRPEDIAEKIRDGKKPV